MAADHPTSTRQALPVVEHKLRRPGLHLRQINLILACLALKMHPALASLAKQRAADFNLLVHSRCASSHCLQAVLLARFSPCWLWVAFRLSLREWGRLALAATPQLLDDLLQLRDSALLLQLTVESSHRGARSFNRQDFIIVGRAGVVSDEGSSSDGFGAAADVQDFVAAQGFELGFAKGDDRDGFAHGVEHFQRVTRLLTRPSM